MAPYMRGITGVGGNLIGKHYSICVSALFIHEITRNNPTAKKGVGKLGTQMYFHRQLGKPLGEPRLMKAGSGMTGLSSAWGGGSGAFYKIVPLIRSPRSLGQKPSSKRMALLPPAGNRCLAVGVVKSAGYWFNSNTFSTSRLFLLKARPRNGSPAEFSQTHLCSPPPIACTQPTS